MDSAADRPAGRNLSTLVVGMLAGALIAATAITAQGTDLRPARTTDIADLVAEAKARNEELQRQAEALRADNERLAAEQGATEVLAPAPEVQFAAGLSAVVGPAVRVSLSDAPVDYDPVGVDPELLVIHEQDVQTFVNALWAGGAEAMTIQGQRVVATTAVKCVGNTIVLEGVPYAPPYVITAIGDQDALVSALDADPKVQIFQQYVAVHHLGYTEQRLSRVEMPAYTGILPDQAVAQPNR